MKIVCLLGLVYIIYGNAYLYVIFLFEDRPSILKEENRIYNGNIFCSIFCNIGFSKQITDAKIKDSSFFFHLIRN